MKSICILAIALVCGCSKSENVASPPAVEGFAAPESILYDALADQYWVSNMNGDPFAVDHDGYLSRVSPDGTVIARKFIDGAGKPDGLSAPKGWRWSAARSTSPTSTASDFTMPTPAMRAAPSKSRARRF